MAGCNGEQCKADGLGENGLGVKQKVEAYRAILIGVVECFLFWSVLRVLL